MIDPITAVRPLTDPSSAYAVYESSKMTPNDFQHDTIAAEEEVVSLWYLSSIKSLQATEPPTGAAVQKEAIGVQAVKNEPSRLQKIRSWLSGWFGGNTASEVENNSLPQDIISTVPSITAGLSHSPQLQMPEPMSNERLSKAIADLNKDLLHRLKDTAEFAEELLKSNSNDMDRLILFHIVSKSMEQKKLKEGTGLEAHEHIFNLQRQNKSLHQEHYDLLDDLKATAKTNKRLHWISLGTTAGIVGTMAVGFATGGTGTVFAIAMPALNVLKGGLSATEGILKYKNDLRTGEMTMINHDVKANRGKISDKLNTTLSYGDEEISHLLKTVRHHLENYSKEARLNPQS